MKRFIISLALGLCGLAVGQTADSVQLLKTKHFAIYWLTSGPNAPVSRDADGNGRPDYVDTAAADLEAAYSMLADSLHYRLPLGQTMTSYTKRMVPDGLYPVEILDLATANSFWKGTKTSSCVLDSASSPNGSDGSQIWLENDFLDHGTDSIWVMIRGVVYRNWVKEPYTALKFATAHSLYHAFTYSYDYYWKYAFHEMAAVWFESWYAPETQNYWRYLPLFRDNLIAGAFDNSNQQAYGNFLYIKSVVESYGVDVVRKLWEDRSLNSPGNDDLLWFREAWERMGIGEISKVTNYYAINSAKLITGQRGEFDDNGKLVGKINPEFKPFKIGISDTDKVSSWTTSIGGYAIYPAEISRNSIPAGMNIATYSSSPENKGNLVVVHAPSLNTEVYEATTQEHIIGLSESDTALYLINITGKAGDSWNFYGTNRSVGISKRNLGVSPNYTQTRDLLGRSRSGKSASQILIDVSDDKGAARRRIEH